MKRLHHLSPTGVSDGSAARLFGQVADRASEHGLAPEDVFLAWELAGWAPEATKTERAALFLIGVAGWLRLRQGSTRLTLGDGDGIDPELAGLLQDLGPPDADRDAATGMARALARGEVPEALGELIGRPGDPRPLVLDEGRLYHQRSLVLERQAVGGLSALLAAPAPPWTGEAVEAAVQAVEARPRRVGEVSLHLDPDQRQAVTRALLGGLTVVTGGPGTGKTSIVVSLLRALARLDGEEIAAVALAAPTGKAADRLRQSVESALRQVPDPAEADLRLSDTLRPPATLHRLLGASPDGARFRHHEGHPLDARWVVVDEASMVDLHLADRLLRALAPGSRLVLLGDADQLPSVEAGAVFADLCRRLEARHPALVRLNTCHRSDRSIVDVAEAVRDARPERLPALVESVGKWERVGWGGDDRGVRLAPGAKAEDLSRFVEGWWTGRLCAGGRPLEGAGAGWLDLVGRAWGFSEGAFDEDAGLQALLAHYESLRILCLTRVDPLSGTVALNRAFRERLRDGSRGRFRATGEDGFLPGEPVMVTRNDYGRGLFNGDTGVVLRIRERRGGRAAPMAVFARREGFSLHPLHTLHGFLEPAWAITVHKSQGSEYDHVALVLPEPEARLLTRETVYTGLTRARRSVLVVGDATRLAAAARRGMTRDTGLAEGLVLGANSA